MARNIMGTYPTSNMGNPSEQYGEIAKLQKLKALRNARDFGATEAQVATGFQKITGNPIDAVRNKYQADPNVVKQVNQSIGFTQPAVKPATTTPSQVARTGIYIGGQELKKQIGGGVITDPSRVNPLRMQYQQLQGAGEYGQATNAIGTRSDSNRVVNVDPNVAAAYNRPEVGQRTSGGGIYLGKASEQPERQSTPLSALPGNRYNELMAKWREQSAPYNPREREATRVAQARQAAQTEQANVAGEREAGVERFKATEAARGAIGSKEAAAEGATAGIRLEGEYDVKAAEAKAGASEGKDRAKMLKDYSMTLANSEPGSPAYQAAEAGLAELYGQNAVAIPQAAIELLKKNPSAKAQFEAKYGAGSAAQYIKG